MKTDLIAGLSLAVGSASFLISSTKIASPPKVWIASRKGAFYSWLSELLRCPYCVGTWLSIFAVAIYRPRVTHGFFLLDYLVSVMIISGLAMLPVLWIKKALGK